MRQQKACANIESMLVNCPKCGFSQPQDKYCAKCGVDMESFQPTQVSLVGRIFLHPALHISLIVVLVVVAVGYIKAKNREKQSFLAQVERLQNGPVILDRTEPTPDKPETTNTTAAIPDATPTATPSPTTDANALASQDPNLEMKPSNDQSSRVGFVPPTSSTTALGQESSVASASQPPPTPEAGAAANSRSPRASGLKVKAIYAEVDNTTMARWSQRMQAAGQYSQQSDFRMGLLPNIEKEMAADRSIVTLDKVEKSFESNPQQEWFVGKTIRDQAIGFKTNLSLSPSERGDALHGEIRVTRNFAEEGDPRSFEGEFEAPPLAGWVFADILSRQYRIEPQEEMNPTSIFQIFTFPRFKNLQTQFAMLFIFERPTSRAVSP